MSIVVYYDGECPFCTRYIGLLRLREAAGPVELVDLRRNAEARARFERLGIDVDQGMVAELDGQWFAGADAIHRLALLGTPVGPFNRFNRWAFRNRTASHLLYPLLRAGRNATLFLLGRVPIHARRDRRMESYFALFSVMWGVFAFLHYLIYAFDYRVPILPTTVLTSLLGIVLLFNPRSRRVFAVLLAVMVVDALQHMPIYSNHTMIQNVVVVAMLLAGLVHWLRADRWHAFVRDFAVVGRCALLVMYFFGVFHKINTGFLDPSVSCAVVLWERMPLPLRVLDFGWVHFATIYGALFIEAAIFVMLLTRRWRHHGIILGVGFHMLLALSGYAMYAPFSMLSIALHTLFLSPESAHRIAQSRTWRRIMHALHAWRGRLLFAAWAGAIYLLAWNGSYSLLGIVWILGILPYWYAVARHGRDDAAAQIPARQLLWSPLLLLNAVSALFLFNGFAPYLGIKTAQSINMFANLRLEGGVSNHLVLSGPPGPFRYLDDIVRIDASSGSAYLGYLQRENLYAVYYDLLDALDRSPHATVSFTRDGVRYEDQSAATLQADMQRILHPRWVRNWLHFTPVDVNEPKPCALDR